MARITISEEELDDFVKESFSFDELFSSAKDTIKAGGSFVISNREGTTVREMSSLAELDIWKEQIFPSQDLFLFSGEKEVCPVLNYTISGGETSYVPYQPVGGGTVFVPRRRTPLRIDFECKGTIQDTGSMRMSNKKRITFDIVIETISQTNLKHSNMVAYIQE